MLYTQIEITAPNGSEYEVWWIPVPEGKAKVGELVTRKLPDTNRGGIYLSPIEDWTITQVCTTLREEDIPKPANIARNFKRDATTIAVMYI